MKFLQKKKKSFISIWSILSEEATDGYDTTGTAVDQGLFEAVANVMIACKTPSKRRKPVDVDHIRLTCQALPKLYDHLVKYFKSPESCMLEADAEVVKDAVQRPGLEVRTALNLAKVHFCSFTFFKRKVAGRRKGKGKEKGKWKWSFGRNGNISSQESILVVYPQQLWLMLYHWAIETGDITRLFVWQFNPLCLHFTT